MPYIDHGNPFGNCDGCFLKSEASKALLIKEHRSRAIFWERLEDEIGATFRDKMSLKDLRLFVDRQGDWIFDDDAALCQADDGECFG